MDQETEGSAEKLCLVCKKQFAKYTCPKCSAGYCSLPCYKNHSGRCVENFQQENIVQMLKSQGKVSNETKKKMMETLLKFERDNPTNELMDESEEELDDDDIEQLQNLNLDGDFEAIFSKLTPAQRREFQKALEDGMIGNWVDVWEPWWTRKPDMILPGLDEKEEEGHKYPQVIPALVKLNTIISDAPSPLLKYNLVNILYSYAYVMRLFNGDYRSDLADAISTVMALSCVLNENYICQSTIEAMEKAVHTSLLPPVLGNKSFAIGVLEDISQILGYKQHVMAALSDLHKLFKESKLRRFKIYTRKVYFFLVWVNEEHGSLFQMLSEEAKVEWENQTKILEQSNGGGNNPNREVNIPTQRQETTKKPFIVEEIIKS